MKGAQLESVVRAAGNIQAQYGQLTFGLVAVGLVVVLVAWVWQRFIAPDAKAMSAARLAAAEEFTKATSNIVMTCQSQERMQADIRSTMAMQEKQTKSLEQLVTALIEESSNNT